MACCRCNRSGICKGCICVKTGRNCSAASLVVWAIAPTLLLFRVRLHLIRRFGPSTTPSAPSTTPSPLPPSPLTPPPPPPPSCPPSEGSLGVPSQTPSSLSAPSQTPSSSQVTFLELRFLLSTMSQKVPEMHGLYCW